MLYENIKTMADVKHFVKGISSHYFDRDIKSFFNRKIESGLFRGKYFITSEQFDHQNNRRYTVRKLEPTGNMKSIPGFRYFSTKKCAEIYIKEINNG